MYIYTCTRLSSSRINTLLQQRTPLDKELTWCQKCKRFKGRRETMMSNLPVPEPMNWMYFKEQWENYLVVYGLSEKDNTVNIATFLVIVRKECYQVYRKLALSKDQRKNLTELIGGLESYFRPKKNVTFERYVFNTCHQEAQETIDEYVNRLRGMSETCEFGDLKDNLIRDRIVLGTKYHSVRGRLLTEELTLEKSISICRSYELVQKQMKQIEKSETDQAYQIERRSVKPQHFRSLNSRSDPEKNWQKCIFCGTRHAQNKQKCPVHFSVRKINTQ